MLIRYATSADNGPLAQLAALTPMDGAIGLRIHRHPDFFGLLRERGDYTVWVAEEADGCIVGSFSATRVPFHIHGEKKWIHYLGDLRIHPRCRGGNLAFRLVRQLYKQLLHEGADLLFCTAAEGNAPVMDFFRGRAGIPTFQQVATFLVYQLIPKKSGRRTADPVPDPAQLQAFYEDFYRPYSFRPAIEHLDACTHFVSTSNHHLTAAATVFDPSALKQNTVIHYPQTTALALGGLRILGPFLGLPPIPRKNEALKILYIKYLGFAAGRERQLHELLRQIRQYAFLHQYHLVSVAVDARDASLKSIIRPLSRFVFRSIGLMTSLQDHMPLVGDISRGILYEDFSLV